MTLPHAYNLANLDLIHLRHTANFWAERAESSTSTTTTTNKNSGTSVKEKDKDKDKSRIGRRRASKPFKRSKTLMESS